MGNPQVNISLVVEEVFNLMVQFVFTFKDTSLIALGYMHEKVVGKMHKSLTTRNEI